MSDKWSDPSTSSANQNPYVDWWNEKEVSEEFRDLFNTVPFVPFGSPRALSGIGESLAIAEYDSVPIPKHAINTEESLPNWDEMDFPAEVSEILPDDLVIVGIIDTGIALGHRRFRRKDGTTRFLAAWQQTSEFKGQADLPCGQELYAQDINGLLRMHTRGDLVDGRLNEDAFNRAAYLVEPHQPLGHRDLDYRAAHGTHVLDLATGFDPDHTSAATIDKYRIIAVNLPPQYIYGSAGNFLIYFAVFALERILCLADALWRQNNPDKVASGTLGGYPIVINFSYGMEAGPKDGGSSWENAIRQLIDGRAHRTQAPTRLVMPVGNENLERGAAVALMGTGQWVSPKENLLNLTPEICLPWRIKPSDQTSNFVEIWGSTIGDPLVPPTREDFKVFVTPPGGSRLLVPNLAPGQHADLGDYARVYCPRPQTVYPLRLVICVAPTLRYANWLVTAPAGIWEIVVSYEKAKVDNKALPVDVAFYIQSDQSLRRHSTTGERSYFDHQSYKTHREDGRLRDSYDYETGEHEEPWSDEGRQKGQGPVQRKGTHNALASNPEITVVGGYRLTDGRPTLYSATLNGDRWRDVGRKVMDGLYPTEDGPAHFGLLGAGSRDGSMVALRGTSMASALATRDTAEELVRCKADGSLAADCASPVWLRQKAIDYKESADWPDHYHRVKKLKGGSGHRPMPESLIDDRLPRFGKH